VEVESFAVVYSFTFWHSYIFSTHKSITVIRGGLQIRHCPKSVSSSCHRSPAKIPLAKTDESNDELFISNDYLPDLFRHAIDTVLGDDDPSWPIVT
jgi:hypothetical protein